MAYTQMGVLFILTYINKNPSIGVAFNPGTLQLREGLEALKNILAVTDVLFLNKDEAEMLLDAKFSNAGEAHEKLAALGPKITVITDGANGAGVFDGNQFLASKPVNAPQKIVDRTGAGDAFASGFLAALFYKKPLQTALLWGMKNSESKLGHIGGINGLLTLQTIQN